jgi:predicted dehydrogenase
MRFLIAGFGSIGRRHFRNLLELGERDLVFYRTHRSTLPDDELRDYIVETDLGAALAHRPDAVIVANPTALHLDVAIPAARQGCHLLLEKPIAHTLQGVADLRAAVAQSGARVLVGFQFRFHPSLRRIKRWLEDGLIGRVVHARAHWGEYLPAWHPWEDYRRSYAARPDLGGGVVLTLCHPFDYLRWLLGEVESVSAHLATLGDLDLAVEDTAEITLQFTSGALAQVHLDYLQRPPNHHLEIIGTAGMIRWDNTYGTARVYHASTETWETYTPPTGFERNHMFVDELRHFRKVVRGEEPAQCTLDDGIRALAIALAAHESSRRGQRVNLDDFLSAALEGRL